MARPEVGEGIGRFVVSLEDMMKFETIEILLELSYLLTICHHARVTAVWLSNDLVDDKLWVTTDVKPLDPKLSGDAQVVDDGLILHHIVCYAKMQSNHVEEMISLGGDQHNASPDPMESEGAVKVHTPVLSGNQGR
jgi:hypothetical protein